MLKSLYPNVDWENIKVVGFDMDGTLYDEFSFISQVYHPITEALTPHKQEQQDLWKWMTENWLEKGSSYPYLFNEAIDRVGIPIERKESLIRHCLSIYRTYSPTLELSPRVQCILEYFKHRFELFILTDGKEELQRRKYNSLKLQQFVQPHHFIASGGADQGFQKPSTRILPKLENIHPGMDAASVVYFGDRDVDRLFAQKCGFFFIRVNEMKPI